MSWKNKYYDAIAFWKFFGLSELCPVKYHSIEKGEKGEGRFERMIKRKFPTVRYINYYEKSDRSFAKRVYLT